MRELAGSFRSERVEEPPQGLGIPARRGPTPAAPCRGPPRRSGTGALVVPAAPAVAAGAPAPPTAGRPYRHDEHLIVLVALELESQTVLDGDLLDSQDLSPYPPPYP